jgi:phosphoribosylformimino-5-aminoimidazole carboxamide ribotide isomerase
MLLIPAIDLKDGHCVRLKQGEMDAATVFSEDPGATARHWIDQGARRLHVVDLDGAFAGKPKNQTAIRAILAEVGDEIPVQLGGGIRDLATIERWLAAGITRVILGTVALRNPALVKQACAKYPGRIVVGIDAKAGHVAVEGWGETSSLTAIDLARRFEDAGVAAIVFTDIDRDGILQGLNIDSTLALADAVAIPVIASGGLASLDDIRRLLQPDCRKIAGAISGRALYDGRLDPAAALALIREAR